MMNGKKALVLMLVISCIALLLLLALAIVHNPKISPRRFSRCLDMPLIVASEVNRGAARKS